MEPDTGGNDFIDQSNLLKKLKEVWRRHPESSFGTLIMDVSRWDPKFLMYATDSDINYMLDRFEERA